MRSVIAAGALAFGAGAFALAAEPRPALPSECLAARVAAAPQAPAVPQDPAAYAYLDPTAREMVRLARLRRQTVDRSITAYQVVARERSTYQLGAGRHERLAHREETAARIHWRRGGPVRVEALGAREATPLFLAGIRLPSMYALVRAAFDPADSQLFVMNRQELVQVRHPLANNSDAHYRFATGDSTSVRLPDGRTFRLRELRILPRRSDADLITGSFWLDTDTHSVVRAVYRLARPWDLHRDDDEELPRFVPDVFLSLDHYTIDYGFWSLRWWLPHHVSMRGVAEAGIFRAPVEYELFYSEYVVEGDVVAVGGAAADSLEAPACRLPYSVHLLLTDAPTESMVAPATGQQAGTVRVDPSTELAAQQRDSLARERQARNDSIAAERRARRADAHIGDAEAAAAGLAAAEQTRANWRPHCILEIVRPADPQALLTSEWFDRPIWDPGPAFLAPADLQRLTGALKRAAEPPWQFSPPRIEWGLESSGLTRYNRVDGLSVGGRARLDLGRLTADATVRLGTADLLPDLELGLERRTRFGALRLSGYQRLILADPATRGLGAGNSLNALLFGRDDGDYFRARGAELTGRPSAGARQWYDWRLFAERQMPAAVGTQFSLRRNVFNREHAFRPNIAADSADQLGAALRLHTAGGLNSESFRWGAELSLDGQTGSYRFARPAAVAHVWVPLPRRLLARLELAGGSSTGQVPAQSLWYLGGPASLRGYAPTTASGQAFWRGRAAVSTRLPGVRLETFTDFGWAGQRAEFTTRSPLRSAGAGLTFLDGIIRFDVARALREPTGWRVDLHLDIGHDR